MGPRGSDATGGHEADPLHVVPSAQDLERALTSVTGVATAEVHSSSDGSDRLRLSLVPGAEPEVVAWSVAATLRERFGIALDPATIALRPSQDVPEAATTTAPPPPQLSASSADGFAGDPALVDAARAAMRNRAARASDQLAATGAATPPPLATPGPPAAPDTPPDTAPDTERATDEDDRARPRPGPRRGTLSGTAATATAASHAVPADPRSLAPDARSTTGEAEPAPAPADRGGDGSAPRRRAAIRELVARPDGDDLAVLATLRLADREATGQARGLGTRRGRWRVIAEATLTALGELTDGRLRADVDHVTVLAFPDLAHVTVSVTVLGAHGEERFLGAAMLRDDPDRAVMRATLDAVNRRVEPWLADGERSA